MQKLVFKLESDNFPVKQKVFLDTNVIYWNTYASSRVFPSSLKPAPYQLNDYSSLLAKLIENENTLYFSQYSIPELVHIVAGVESTLDACGSRHLRKKWLREKGREIVAGEIHSVIAALQSWATPLTPSLPYTCEKYIERYAQVYLDGYDLFLEKELTENEITLVLTDDADFFSVDGLNLVTANKTIRAS
ncbi:MULTISPECIES: hypothetical protein [unclassified Shewanella]|uniref:hypothetical protein n=1 Tax=unclassified Shewanella TaxID=196818 RepID=UPI0021D96524|nr:MULTISPECIES: hypothetical protein [unclassified Shewanella]MCU8035033.1 hypothetical protein [Shewanella sp. SM71]MCU8096903.1 hypothetical protein [Shewanella sp. SM102]